MAADNLRVLFVLRYGLPSERLRANMLASLVQQRSTFFEQQLHIRSIEARTVNWPQSWSYGAGQLQSHSVCEELRGQTNDLRHRLELLRSWQPNVISFVKLPPLEPFWRNQFPQALLVVDVVDNVALIRQLMERTRHTGGCSFDLALVQTNATRQLLHSSSNPSTRAMRVAVIPHQHTNFGDWRVRTPGRRRPQTVGILIGSKWQHPSADELLKLAQACCPLELTLAVFFERQEEANKPNAAGGPQTTVTRFECAGTHVARRSSASASQRAGVLVSSRGARPYADDVVFNFSEQALYNDVSWVNEVNIGLLWPPGTNLDDLPHRPPTRLLFWWSHGIPAIFFPYAAYSEVATRFGYRLPNGALPQARSVAEFHAMAAAFVAYAALRTHLSSVGLEASRHFSVESIAAQYLSAIREHVQTNTTYRPRRPLAV